MALGSMPTANICAAHDDGCCTYTLLKRKVAEMGLEVRRHGALNVELARPVAVTKFFECCIDLRDILSEYPFSGACDASACSAMGYISGVHPDPRSITIEQRVGLRGH